MSHRCICVCVCAQAEKEEEEGDEVVRAKLAARRRITALSYSANGRHLITGAADHFVRVFSCERTTVKGVPECVARFYAKGEVSAVAVQPQGGAAHDAEVLGVGDGLGFVYLLKLALV